MQENFRAELDKRRLAALNADRSYSEWLKECQEDAVENQDDYFTRTLARLGRESSMKAIGKASFDYKFMTITVRMSDQGVVVRVSHNRSGPLHVEWCESRENPVAARRELKEYLNTIERLENLLYDLNVRVSAEYLAWRER